MRDNYNDFRPWIGYDLDGTLANAGKEFKAYSIGQPVTLMVDHLKANLEKGERVKIFTARVCHTGQRSPISGMVADAEFVQLQHHIITLWCKHYFDRDLEVTCIKDFLCKEIYDDRAWRVDKNTGLIFGIDVFQHEWNYSPLEKRIVADSFPDLGSLIDKALPGSAE